MEIRKIECKTALSSSSLPGLTYSLNPYRGCQHNCAYCYAPNVLRIDRQKWGCVIEAKTNIPLILSKELKHKKPGIVGISTVTDPYQPVEKKYKLTRYCLEQLLKHDFPICVQTKSSLVLRDIDLMTKFSAVEVMVSIATLNDNERRLLEPYSSSIKERLDALRKYSDAGVKTSIFFGPIYPTIKKEELPAILDVFADCKISEILIDGFNLKPGILENIKGNISCDPALYDLFLKNVIENKEYYRALRNEIFEIGKAKNIKIIDAF
jgi:DNA repair photolyase